jgi:hypothetical protein
VRYGKVWATYSKVLWNINVKNGKMRREAKIVDPVRYRSFPNWRLSWHTGTRRTMIISKQSRYESMKSRKSL